jgi:DNA polymerase-3 subunit delta
MSYEQIISSLKKKEYKPIYFLMGDEPFFIDKITDYISHNVLKEHERDFNQTVLYGKDINVDEIISAAKRFPMMSKHQVIIIKEAQHVKQIENLEKYLAQPLNSTILVINYKFKKLDKRKAVAKLIAKLGVIFESAKLRDYKIPDWITAKVSESGLKIQPKNTMLLAEFLGTDISKIDNELNKLKLILPKGSEITTEAIEKNIGISKDYNIFELQSALAKKDVLKSNLIAIYFAQNPKKNPFVLSISSLFNYFSKVLQMHFSKNKGNDNALAGELKVHPFFVKEYKLATQNYSAKKLIKIVSYLREYDLKSKGVDNSTTDDGELLKELIFKILH